jgi:hypothetical protein
MASADQFPCFDLDIRGLFEQDHLFTPFHLATVDDNLNTSFYVSLFLAKQCPALLDL